MQYDGWVKQNTRACIQPPILEQQATQKVFRHMVGKNCQPRSGAYRFPRTAPSASFHAPLRLKKNQHPHPIVESASPAEKSQSPVDHERQRLQYETPSPVPNDGFPHQRRDYFPLDGRRREAQSRRVCLHAQKCLWEGTKQRRHAAARGSTRRRRRWRRRVRGLFKGGRSTRIFAAFNKSSTRCTPVSCLMVTTNNGCHGGGIDQPRNKKEARCCG